METGDQQKTVAIKACRACGGGLLERDSYCRWCGVRQVTTSASSEVRLDYTTKPLERRDLYHPVSGPLVKAMIEGVGGTRSARLQSGFSRRLVLALISIPVWMIIILLSPLDAYASAKLLTGRM